MATRSSSSLSRQEAGRKGAEARWGTKSSSRGGRQTSEERGQQGRMSRQEAGRKGAEARWGRESSNRQGQQGRMSREEAGRRGTEAHWGMEQNEHQGQQGRMSRQEAGRKGAEAHWGMGQNERQGQQGRMSHREAGRKGAEARWGMGQDERQGQQGRLSRQEAGRRGAEARWGGGNFEHDYDDYRNQDRRLQGRWEDEETPRRGGERITSEYGQGFYEDIGRRGGLERNQGWNELEDDYGQGRSRRSSFSRYQDADQRGTMSRWFGEDDEDDYDDEDDDESGYNRERMIHQSARRNNPYSRFNEGLYE